MELWGTLLDILKTTEWYTSDDVMTWYITYLNKTVIMGKILWDYGKNIYNF